jgi:hypothetical protein
MDKQTTLIAGALVLLGVVVTDICYADQALGIALAAGLGAVALVLALLTFLQDR